MKKRSKLSAEFNMSSLTDIIFLLLIFFMLNSSLASPNTKNIDLPTSSSTTPSPQNVAVSITEKGEYFVESEQVTQANLEEKMADAIERERLKIKQKKLHQDEVTVVLNVAKKEKTRTIVDMMKMSNKLGVRLILATEAPKK